MSRELFLSLLRQPPAAISYALTRRLAEIHRGKYVLESEEPTFDALAYLAAADVSVTEALTPRPQRSAYFGPPPDRARRPLRTRLPRMSGTTELDVELAQHVFEWRSRVFELVTLSFVSDQRTRRRRYLIADSEAIAKRFFEAVCTFNARGNEEILVFEDGSWTKSQRLYRAVHESSLESIVPSDGLAIEILDDLRRFLAARDDYARFGVPYKRGALLVGPPGNGKTLCIKALVRELDLPCHWVQSFEARGASPRQNVAAVFERVRRNAPCVLVLEHLDLLVGQSTRACVLNQLDGFERNDGLITIASAHDVQALDHSLWLRPGRFDRTYRFSAPGPVERGRYVNHWNKMLPGEAALSAGERFEIGQASDGFSYAHLRELFLRSWMRWSANRAGSFGEVVLDEAKAFRRQLAGAPEVEDVEPALD